MEREKETTEIKIKGRKNKAKKSIPINHKGKAERRKGKR